MRSLKSKAGSFDFTEGWIMRNKANLKFLGIVLIFTLGTILIAYQSCKKDRFTADHPSSLGIAAEDSSPSWSPDGTRIAFNSNRDENWEICLIDADGSNLINLTNTPEIDEMYPHASPDGRLICFEAVEGEDKESKSRNVYIMNIDGTGKVKIADNADQPFWSPDGRYIAYLPGEYPRYDPTIYSNKGLEVYDLNTGEKKRHPNEQIYHIWCLCWSPDGEWFVSAHGRDMLGRENAFKADDKAMMCLSMEGCTPDISPNGKRISWNGTDWNINIGKLDFDSPQSSVTGHKIVVACDLEHWVYHSDWSPDGKYLIFTYGKEGGNMPGKPAPGSNICICDLRTGKWTQVTTDGKHNKEPDWVPEQEGK
jgi:Tol biopolymer transport system component